MGLCTSSPLLQPCYTQKCNDIIVEWYHYMEIQYQPYFTMAVKTNIRPFCFHERDWEKLPSDLGTGRHWGTWSTPTHWPKRRERGLLCVEGCEAEGVLPVGYPCCVERREWVSFWQRYRKKSCYICDLHVHTPLLQFSIILWFCPIHVSKIFHGSYLVEIFWPTRKSRQATPSFPHLSEGAQVYLIIFLCSHLFNYFLMQSRNTEFRQNCQAQQMGDILGKENTDSM